MSETVEPGDADLRDRSLAARTPDERAAVFGFDLPAIRRAAGRLRVASTLALLAGAAGILVVAFFRPSLDLGGLLIGFLLGLVAPVATFVIAQIVVRLFSSARTSAVAVATAPVTAAIAALLLLGALLLAPPTEGAFAGLLLGTWAAGSIEAGGHVATRRAFDLPNPALPRTARIWNDYPRWASLAFGQWGWVFVFSVLAGLTGVAALLVFRDAGLSPVTLVVIAVLALASVIEAWATTRNLPLLRLGIAVLALAGLVAAWMLL